MSPNPAGIGDFSFAENMLYEYLTSSTGSIEMASTIFASASSTAPVDFTAGPSTSESMWRVQRLNVVFQDASMTPAKFGGIAALTNGVQVLVLTSTGGTAKDFTGGAAITKNIEWGLLAGSDTVVAAASGEDGGVVRWTLARSGSALLLRPGEKLCLRVRDNISAITEYRAMVQGEYSS